MEKGLRGINWGKGVVVCEVWCMNRELGYRPCSCIFGEQNWKIGIMLNG